MAVAVYGEPAEHDAGDDVWDGGEGAADDDDRAGGVIGKAKDGVGSGAAEFDIVAIEDDGIVHREG